VRISAGHFELPFAACFLVLPQVSASFWETSTAVDGCELFPKQAAHVDIESFIDQVTSVSGQVICLRTATSSTLGSKNCDEIGAHLQKV